MRRLYHRQTVLLILYAALIAPGCSYAGGKDTPEEKDPFLAAKRGEIDSIKLLLKDNPGLLNARNDIGASLLHYAAQRNHPELVHYLVKEGAEVDAVDMSRETPLYYAARWGSSFEAAKALIELGADINHRPSWRLPYPIESSDGIVRTHTREYSVLEIAAGAGDYRLVELLLKKGAKIEPASPAGENALQRACCGRVPQRYEKDPEAAGNRKTIALLTKHIDINYRNKHGLAPLHNAARYGAVETVKYLISNYKKLDLNPSAPFVGTPLRIAVDPRGLGGPVKDRAEVIKLLIKAGADVNIEYANQTPRQLAEKLGNKTILKAFDDAEKQ